MVTGRPAALREALALRVAELRLVDPLAPITVLVGASLQRPFLQRWLAARLGAHANVRILMPGDLALVLGASALVAQGRRALPPLADRVLLAEVARKHPGYFEPVAETPGFGEALFRLVRELRGAGYDLSDLGPLLDGATDATEKAPSLAEILAEFERRRTGFYGPDDALQAADPSKLPGLGLLVWGMLDMPPALERLLAEIAGRLPVDVYLADEPAAADAPLADSATAASGERGLERLVDGGSEGTSALVRVRRSLFTPPVKPAIEADGTLAAGRRRQTHRGRCAPPLALASPGRERGSRSGIWPSPTGAARRTCRWSRRCSSRPGSPCTCTRARRWPSGRSGARRSRCSTLFDGELSRQAVMDFLTDAKLPERTSEGVRRLDLDLAVGLAVARGGDRQGRRAVAATARGDARSGGCTMRTGARVGEASASEDAAGSQRFIAELDRRLRDRPGTDDVGGAPRLPAAAAGPLCRGRRRGRGGAARAGALHRARGRGRLRLVPRRGQAGDRHAALRGRDRQPPGRVRAPAA